MKSLQEIAGQGVRKLHELGLQYYSKQQLLSLYGFLFIGAAALLLRISGVGPGAYQLDPDSKKAQELKVQEFLAVIAREKLQDSLHFYLPASDTNLATNTLGSSSQPRPASAKEKLLLGKTIALNKASREELMQLPAVGPSTADRILDYRNTRGKFRSLSEITNVNGIGAKKFELLRQFLRLD